jgi:thymidylate synthase
MSQYDAIYKKQVNQIIKYGVFDKDQEVRPKWIDGTPAYSKAIISKQLIFDNSEVPILTTKRVAWKTAIHELIWFYIKRTSDTTYLDENNVKIWKEWTRKDNTIGTAYGYQLGKQIRGKAIGLIGSPNKPSSYVDYDTTNQVHKLIEGLKNDPASRRHIISLWNIDDTWDMALQPCVWHSQFLIKEGKLNLIVGIRSNDVALGQPFNIFQYYVLQRMIAQVTGYELGQLIFNINDTHIYERHIPTIKKQVKLKPYDAPTLWINPDIKNFDDFTIDDFDLRDYNYHPSLKYEVAI